MTRWKASSPSLPREQLNGRIAENFGHGSDRRAGPDAVRRFVLHCRTGIGYMPLYVPREIIHAANMLPLGILGGGDQLEVIHGDAYYQSYICRIPRSTV